MSLNNLPLPMERQLMFTTQVNQNTIGCLVQSIIQINKNDDLLESLYKLHGLDYKRRPIEIYIDSYGGFVYQIFGLIGVMENSKTHIHTIVTGAAMSAGFMMLISGHKRFGYSICTPMYHQVSSSTSGNISDMVDEIKQTKNLQNKLEEIVLKKTKISKNKLEKIKKSKKDWYMNAEEALKLGVIDEII